MADAVRIMGPPKKGIVGGRAKGCFVHVEAADDRRPVGAQHLHDPGIAVGDAVAVHTHAAGPG